LAGSEILDFRKNTCHGSTAQHVTGFSTRLDLRIEDLSEGSGADLYSELEIRVLIASGNLGKRYG